MTRRHFTFPCAGDELAATVDEASGTVGLLMVTGGNETRAGAFSGQAQMAARIAAAGYPVLRFDRRGVGDSSGENSGFTGSAEDIAAAIAAFRHEQPQITRLVGFGNCDAASALMLTGGAGLDALALANPWTFDTPEEAPPPEAVRHRYAEKLKNPREVLRLITGGVSLKKLASGIRQAMRPAIPPSSLARRMSEGIDWFGKPDYRFLLAGRDRTAQAFRSICQDDPAKSQICAEADHAFSSDLAREWLFKQLFAILDEQARQLDMG
ncbi:hydrolase 1, exosortase A system-associated [Altererythrobacter sp. KTW20L]|uniref:hydrolase 1, exosortase A system-associated n=1 Tax=Altererythrobacter sp. KTW20L TaxID=2942210 RepID=UPI0020BE0AEA|nr:hydrolase 1, exosortase A system-associated [Altererythrobacter sp. KTW20L]